MVYLLRPRVESRVPIILRRRAKIQYSNCHYRVEAGKVSRCSHCALMPMHEIDSVRKSRSGITFCGQAFFFPGVHALPGSAGRGPSSLGHRAPLPMQISRLCCTFSTNCSCLRLDNGCSDSWVLDGGECSQVDSMGVLVNNQSRYPEIIADVRDRKHNRFVEYSPRIRYCSVIYSGLPITFIGCCSLEEQTSRA